MKVLSLRYQHLLQHYKKRNPPWVKMDVRRLGPHAVDRRLAPDEQSYLNACWTLSDNAKLLLSYLEMLASRHEYLLHDNVWLANELRVLQLAQQPRLLAKALAELLAKGLADSASVSAINSPLYSGSLGFSGGLGEREREGVEPGDGTGLLEDELPSQERVIEALRAAVGEYELAAAQREWPKFNRLLMPDLESFFEDVDTRLRELDPDFDWLICFARATEQSWLAKITGFGFPWFVKRESSGPLLNAWKVWQYGFASAEEKARIEGRFGDERDRMEGFHGERSRFAGNVVRWPGARVLALPSGEFGDIQFAFAFAAVRGSRA